MTNTNDIHYIAEKFLRDHLATQADTLTTERLEQAERKVVMVRDRIPEYFVDFKSTGRAIWSHDIRYAKVIPEAEFESWEAHFHQIGEDITGVSKL